MLALPAPLPADHLTTLYGAQVTAEHEFEAACTVEDVTIISYGWDHPWTQAASRKRSEAAHRMSAARFDYAGATYDPMTDFNYVGSHHHY